MPRSEIRALNTALQRGEFEPAYLFHGDDDFLKEAKVRAIIERATDPGTRDFNFEALRGAELDAGALSAALAALPMMAERRVLVVRDVTALKKDARTALVKYLRRPATDTVLVMTATAGAKVEKELLDGAVAVDFRPLNDNDLGKWIAHQAKTLGVEITPKAAELLAGATGNDLALLTGEMDKLRSYTNGGTIDEQAVGAIVGVKEGETLADLLDLIARRESRQAIALIAPVLQQSKMTGVYVVMALTTQLLAIGWGLAARDRGLAQSRFESEFFGLLKENPSSVAGRPWGEAVKVWTRALAFWDHASVESALRALAAADASLKDTKISSEEQILTSLVLSFTARTPRRAAA